MPKYSIIVPIYNTGKYLEACFNSLLNQTEEDWEVVAVIDGSPDNATDIVNSYAEKDSRISAIFKSKNEGTHLARKSGVAKANGTYTLFLDADDQLVPTCLEEISNFLDTSNCDVLHYGCHVIGDKISENQRLGMEAFCNRNFPILYGEQITHASFVLDHSEEQDWRVVQRVFKTELAKHAFLKMTDNRLGRGQDCYEWLVLASLASSQVTDTSLKGYLYYLGRGITSSTQESIPEIVKTANSYAALLAASSDYASSFSTYDLTPTAESLRTKIIEYLMEDWAHRIPDTNKLTAALTIADILGKNEIAAELMRFSRDAAYELWDKGKQLDENAPFLSWMDVAENLHQDSEAPSPRYDYFSDAANRHVLDLRKRMEQERNSRGAHTMSNMHRLIKQASSLFHRH
jgi:cobalamin biosynthesis Mg chelatase CobN